MVSLSSMFVLYCSGGVPAITSILEGLDNAFGVHGSVEHEKGCDINSDDTSGIERAADLARNADATVVVIGINQDIESEGRDRLDIVLPGHQRELVEAVSESNPHGNTVVVGELHRRPLHPPPSPSPSHNSFHHSLSCLWRTFGYLILARQPESRGHHLGFLSWGRRWQCSC